MQLADTGFGVAIYACMTVYRAIMLFGAIPLFKHAHYGFDWRDALVCIWGGLRGAVGLALALAITSDELIVDCDEVEAAVVADGGCSFAGAARFKRVALLHMCITVGVTLLVNAPSSSLLVKAVGLTKLPGRKVSAVQVCWRSQRALRLPRTLALAGGACPPWRSRWEESSTREMHEGAADTMHRYRTSRRHMLQQWHA